MVIAVRSAADLAPRYDAIVVGSGYGGGVAASRLSRMGLQVAVIERGRLWKPGDFPVTEKARRKSTRLTGRVADRGDPAGLYSVSVGKGLTVFGASGLGGSSLINAGIALRPDLGFLRKKGWPTAVLDDGLFAEGMARAEAMLGVTPVPEPERFPKYRSLRRVADRGDPAGLYSVSVGKGLTVFGASGLGGSSLINAGIALRPDLGFLRKQGWPKAVLEDGLFAEGMRRAEAMLGVTPVPEPERFPKYRSLRRVADAAGRPVELRPMTIAHTAGPNAAGVEQPACAFCGDCWSGCNLGAKITTAVSYIADAVAHGASVFCESRAVSIAKTPNGWDVVVEDASKRGTPKRTTAPILVLAAGTMGTNELLLRASRDGLTLSKRLGQNFSANGDDLVFATELAEPAHAVATGYPNQAPRGAPAVGPHSMALVDLTDEDGPLFLHDGTMLTMMAALTPYKELIRGKFARALRIFRGGPYGDEMSRVQIFYIVSHDDASGRLYLQKDRVIVDWPAYSGSALRLRAENKVRKAVEKMGGVFHTNPFAMSAFGGNRIIAHPLGGAGMGETAETGVVSPDGRVFDPSLGMTGVHEGLYVLDAAAIPSSVGVSPLLTISALAERAMILAGERMGR